VRNTGFDTVAVAQKMAGGTMSSNPASSSGESGANSISWIMNALAPAISSTTVGFHYGKRQGDAGRRDLSYPQAVLDTLDLRLALPYAQLAGVSKPTTSTGPGSNSLWSARSAGGN
jgi:hypothetical protein